MSGMARSFFSRMKSLFSGEEKSAEQPPASDDPKAQGQTRDAKAPSAEEEAKGRARLAAQTDEIRRMFQHVIEPEERTLKNYISPSFWKTKRDQYRQIKDKEKQDLNVYQMLSDGARPTIEYYILTVLSCVIATTGLLQGSTATIIGAMIVAPLMTPILAFSLGVIWGDILLVRTALFSLLKGMLLAVFISATIAYYIPMAGYSSEILARTQPTLFDIIVALASGIVGAYGNANKKISNTLVGIAIAVALMPPLCTVGIGLGTANMEVAGGAFLLFLINLVSISLAGAVVFWGMKIHPALADQEQIKKRALYQIVLSILLLTAIAVPVGLYMWNGYTLSKARRTVQETVRREMPGVTIFDMQSEKRGDRYQFLITLSGDRTPAPAAVKNIRERLRKECPCIGEIRLRFIQSSILLDEVPASKPSPGTPAP